MLPNIKKKRENKQCTTLLNKIIGFVLYKKPDVPVENVNVTFRSSDFTPETKVGS